VLRQGRPWPLKVAATVAVCRHWWSRWHAWLESHRSVPN
jgi:hypothetical protein